MKIIESAWLTYREMVVPANAGNVQLRECRQAFYGGAAVLFTALTTGNLLDDEDGSIEPTAADLAKMESIHKEIEAFGAELDLGAGIRRQ